MKKLRQLRDRQCRSFVFISQTLRGACKTPHRAEKIKRIQKGKGKNETDQETGTENTCGIFIDTYGILHDSDIRTGNTR